MTKLLGISGSLRRHSFNAGLLRAAVELVPPDVTLDIGDITEIPLYNEDVEKASTLPASVTTLKEAIAAADALLLATPEYNNGIPGVFKNAIDWASRPASDIPRVFGGKPVALIGASLTGFGTILSQTAWLPVLRALSMELWTGGKLMVPGAGMAFDAKGNLVSDAVREKLAHFIAGFIEDLRLRK